MLQSFISNLPHCNWETRAKQRSFLFIFLGSQELELKWPLICNQRLTKLPFLWRWGQENKDPLSYMCVYVCLCMCICIYMHEYGKRIYIYTYIHTCLYIYSNKYINIHRRWICTKTPIRIEWVWCSSPGKQACPLPAQTQDFYSVAKIFVLFADFTPAPGIMMSSVRSSRWQLTSKLPRWAVGTTAARQRLSLLPDLGKGKCSEKTTLWGPRRKEGGRTLERTRQ